MNIDKSKELYKLSRCKSIVNKELLSYNKKEIDNGILLRIIDNDADLFLNDYKGKVDIKTTKFENGLGLKIAIFKLEEKFLALDIEEKYVMNNVEYFENHHNLIYFDKINNNNKVLNNIRTDPKNFNVVLDGDYLQYQHKEFKISRKTNLLSQDEFEDLYQKISKINSNEVKFNKYFLLKDLLKEIDSEILKIKDELINYPIDNEFVSIEILQKQKEISIDYDNEYDTQVEKKINAHLTIKNLIDNDTYILSDAYKKIVNIKVFEIGTLEEIENKIKTLKEDIDTTHQDNKAHINNMIENDFGSNPSLGWS